MKRLSEKLERARAARGMTQAELIRRLVPVVGRTANKAQMSRWLSGDAVPKLAEAAALARALDVPLDYLTDDDQAEPPAGLTADEAVLLDVVRGLLLTHDRAEILARLVTERSDARRVTGRPPGPEIPRTPFRTEVVVTPLSPAPATPPALPGRGVNSPGRSRGRSTG